MKIFAEKRNRIIWGIALGIFAVVFLPFAWKATIVAAKATAHTLSNAARFISTVSISIGGKHDGTTQTASWELGGEKRFVPFRIALGNIKEEFFTPPSVGKMIRVNLETKMLTLYQDGKRVGTYPVERFGKASKASEIPGGEFRILFKNESHYSSATRANLPYAMQFLGNYAIHGTPKNQAGSTVNARLDGSIILADDAAADVYAWSDTKTLVSIYGSEKTAIQRTPIDGSSYFLRDANKKLALNAEAYIVGDLETGEIILEKNKTLVAPIASVSKLFTAATYLDALEKNDTVTVSAAAVRTEGSNGNLRVGEAIPTDTLIYPLLLESSNDGAEVIAEHFGRDVFMNAMNEGIKKLGLANTVLDDPSGISPKNLSTAEDLFAFSRYLYANRASDILAITKTEKYNWKNHTWFNNNAFFAQDRYLGGKTGYTSQAKQTFLSMFSVNLSEFDSRKIAIILLKSADRANDTNSILNYLRSNIFYGRDIAPAKGNPITIGDIFYVPQKEEVTLAFVGDMMLNRGVESSVNRNGKGDYSFLFKNKSVVDILRNADIAFGNLEGPASDKGYDQGSIYSFRMDPEILPLLKNVGFDALSVANNHAGDWSREAFDDTIRRLEENEIAPIGGSYTKPEAEEVRIIERNGIRVGFIGFSDVGPSWLEAGPTRSGILLANDPRFDEIVSSAAEKVDILVTSFHFGDEYKEHNARQEALAKRAIDSGAKVVIGHHPHVPQATEEYSGGFIAYSLGNFIFDQSWSKATMEGLVLELTLNKKGLIGVKQYKTNQNSFFQIEKLTEIKK